MVQSPSWEANSQSVSQSVSQEIPHLSGKPKAHCRVHKSPLLVPILNSQTLCDIS